MPTFGSLAVVGRSCMTPTAPAGLLLVWSRLDSWYPWAASMSQSNSYCPAYRLNISAMELNFTVSSSESESLTHSVLPKYFLASTLPKRVPFLLCFMNPFISFLRRGLSFRTIQAISPPVLSVRSS